MATRCCLATESCWFRWWCLRSLLTGAAPSSAAPAVLSAVPTAGNLTSGTSTLGDGAVTGSGLPDRDDSQSFRCAAIAGVYVIELLDRRTAVQLIAAVQWGDPRADDVHCSVDGLEPLWPRLMMAKPARRATDAAVSAAPGRASAGLHRRVWQHLGQIVDGSVRRRGPAMMREGEETATDFVRSLRRSTRRVERAKQRERPLYSVSSQFGQCGGLQVPAGGRLGASAASATGEASAVRPPHAPTHDPRRLRVLRDGPGRLQQRLRPPLWEGRCATRW